MNFSKNDGARLSSNYRNMYYIVDKLPEGNLPNERGGLN